MPFLITMTFSYFNALILITIPFSYHAFLYITIPLS